MLKRVAASALRAALEALEPGSTRRRGVQVIPFEVEITIADPKAETPAAEDLARQVDRELRRIRPN
jgi:hypothetical protein